MNVLAASIELSRYRDANGCNPEALVEEADYFGLEDLARVASLCCRDVTWFRVGGKRFALDSGVLDHADVPKDCLLRKENLCDVPRDDRGAYVIDRDPELFFAVHNYLTTGNYPSWIHHRWDRRSD
jgi:hypothetical protein